jgi:hypothetical protein
LSTSVPSVDFGRPRSCRLNSLGLVFRDQAAEREPAFVVLLDPLVSSTEVSDRDLLVDRRSLRLQILRGAGGTEHQDGDDRNREKVLFVFHAATLMSGDPAAGGPYLY